MLGNKKEIRTMSLQDYRRRVKGSFNQNSRLFREGPMREISLVGKKGEETGAEFTDFNEKLTKCVPIFRYIIPWGKLALDTITCAKKSDDGPIWWVRPGEQSVSSNTPTTPTKNNSHKVGFKRARDVREVIAYDRTNPHLDHIDNPRQTTHAVGMLKAVKVGHKFSG